MVATLKCICKEKTPRWWRHQWSAYIYRLSTGLLSVSTACFIHTACLADDSSRPARGINNGWIIRTVLLKRNGKITFQILNILATNRVMCRNIEPKQRTLHKMDFFIWNIICTYISLKMYRFNRPPALFTATAGSHCLLGRRLVKRISKWLPTRTSTIIYTHH